MGPETWDLNPVLVWRFCYEGTWRHSELSSRQDVLPGKWSLVRRDGGRDSSSSLLLCKVLLEGIG